MLQEGQTILGHTLYGAVLGKAERGNAVFRGIPYGGPCDGARRFLPPQPPQPWQGELDCTRNGPIAMQEGGSICAPHPLGLYFSGNHPENFGTAGEEKSENCLCLNVSTPDMDEKKRPVLVYIHGGGFSDGSGALALGAQRFTCEQDVTLVSVNHRLNVFGYLYLGHLDEKYAASGVAGMLDLILALRWVRDNIAFFGGDPNRVTIMGESGGGMKVSTLMAMPLARGLFHRAAVESGSMPTGMNTSCRAAENTNRLLHHLGIAPENWRKLLSLSAQTLLKAGNELACGDSLAFSPVADGAYLPADSETNAGGAIQGADISPTMRAAFRSPEISCHIPLLVGASEDEMAIFTPVAEMESVTWDNICRKLAGDCDQPQDREQAAAVRRAVETYRRGHRGEDASHAFVRIRSLMNALGGGAFHQAMARAVVPGAAPVYHYAVHFDVPMPGRPDMLRSWHTADLPLQLRIVAFPFCEEMSRRLAGALGAFVRTGDPSTAELPWPPFTAGDRHTMVFDADTGVQSDPWRDIREA